MSAFPTKATILKQANELLQRFEKDLSKLESCVDYGSDYSVYTGTTGVVVLYWLLANVNVEENVCNVENLVAKRFMEKKLEKQRVCQQCIQFCCCEECDDMVLIRRKQFHESKQFYQN